MEIGGDEEKGEENGEAYKKRTTFLWFAVFKILITAETVLVTDDQQTVLWCCIPSNTFIC